MDSKQLPVRISLNRCGLWFSKCPSWIPVSHKISHPNADHAISEICECLLFRTCCPTSSHHFLCEAQLGEATLGVEVLKYFPLFIQHKGKADIPSHLKHPFTTLILSVFLGLLEIRRNIPMKLVPKDVTWIGSKIRLNTFYLQKIIG